MKNKQTSIQSHLKKTKTLAKKTHVGLLRKFRKIQKLIPIPTQVKKKVIFSKTHVWLLRKLRKKKKDKPHSNSYTKKVKKCKLQQTPCLITANFKRRE